MVTKYEMVTMESEEKISKLSGYYYDYYVSSNGYVFRLDVNGNRIYPKVRKDRDGYHKIAFFGGERSYNKSLHRIVALFYVPNPNGYNMVFHKDRDRDNNSADNLQWGTIKDILERRKKTILERKPLVIHRPSGKDNPLSKPVIQLTRYGEYVCEHDSISSASKAVKIGATKISDVCNGIRYTAADSVWMFKEDYINNKNVFKKEVVVSDISKAITRWRKRIDKNNTEDLAYWLNVIVRASKIYFGINEEWLPVDWYNKEYYISSFGRLKSIDRDVPCKNGMTIFKKGLLLRQTLSDGYLVCSMSLGNKRKTEKIQRLVLKTFNKDGDFSMEANHIDFDKTNNYVGNLEFCTKSDNLRHMWENIFESKIKNIYTDGMSVVCLTPDKEYVKEYASIASASRECRGGANGISRCCKNKQIYSGGYRWMFATDYYK